MASANTNRIETNKASKEILAVSFGTSFAETREKTIGAIERRIRKEFPEYTVRRSFTSRMIRKKLLEREGIRVESPEEALQSALERGVTDLLLQPLYLMHGQEHQRLMETLEEWRDRFPVFSAGSPLLSDERDFRVLSKAIQTRLPAPDPETAVVLMGHGTGTFAPPAAFTAAAGHKGPEKDAEDSAGHKGPEADAKAAAGHKGPEADAEAAAGRKGPEKDARDVSGNNIYAILQETLREDGADRYYIATVEGEPLLEDILPLLREGHYKKVLLAPLMIVAGDHAVNDLAGDGPDSWKSIFLRNGLAVETVLQGIGEWEEVQDLFAGHAAEAQHTDLQSSRTTLQ